MAPGAWACLPLEGVNPAGGVGGCGGGMRGRDRIWAGGRRPPAVAGDDSLE